jgi:hypothetical protein
MPNQETKEKPYIPLVDKYAMYLGPHAGDITLPDIETAVNFYDENGRIIETADDIDHKDRIKKALGIR